MPLRISVIISDYDGTLCPTASLKGLNNQIPPDLEKVLWDISAKIPVCILSTKDFGFLRKKVQFAKVVSCIMGLEIFELATLDSRSANVDIDLVPNSKNYLGAKGKFSNVISQYRLSGVNKLVKNSVLLKKLSDKIEKEFQDISIEPKFNYVDGILAAISLDYRQIQKWEHYKTNIEPYVLNSIQQFVLSLPNDLFVQTYSDHPFIDIYSMHLDKGQAIDAISLMLNLSKVQKVLYLGDSENDNPAFQKADLSIGIRSDERVKTKLDSDYLIQFNELTPFLQKLYAEDFVFNRMSQNIQ
ncbi:MAG TPA: HAD-IIB family hydrolase [Nitrososphaeraceae archaeon]|nr:HAD-IIB family hydrolase [Nitrososphaeraceae archaeon]